MSLASTPDADLRILGIYPQAQKNRYMLRVKVPGGALSAVQARQLADLSEAFSRGVLHLTTRASLELHDLTRASLEPVLQRLDAAGLTSRGACGGAVRGVAVSTPLAEAAPVARALARAVHTHFTGNAAFEGLPKKFKVGVDAGYAGARHLIQDLGLVLVSPPGEPARWDAWVAGGLGRQPTPAFPLATGVATDRILPLGEATVEVYRRHAPTGKRLKHVAEQLGREQLAAEIHAGWRERAAVPGTPVGEEQGAAPGASAALLVPVFGGELPAAALRALADASDQVGDGRLLLTPDQDVALPLPREDRAEEAARRLLQAGLALSPTGPEVLRICPGSHQCKLGLAPTRDLARQLIDRMGPRAVAREWAISGCTNSCSQPQLAQIGIVCAKLARGERAEREPRFDLWRRKGDGFGTRVLEGVSRVELFAAVAGLG
ncbi:MAG TPA: nitrite/sulfite reductase [Deferrisomatales bacterium]|nr:nitrite/sulfite reductase [Deferrisomatales bacterium]